MPNFSTFFQLVILLGIPFTIVSIIIHSYKKKKTPPVGGFWDHLEGPAHQKNDPNRYITIEELKETYQKWADREYRYTEARKDQAEMIFTSKGFVFRGELDDNRLIYEGHGMLYEYDATNDVVKAL